MPILAALFLFFAGATVAQSAAKEPDALIEIRKRGAQLLRAGDWTAARQTFREGLAQSRRLHLPLAQGRFLSNLGGLDFASFQTAEALEHFIQAREIGLRYGDGELEQVATLNMATVFARYGDWSKALETVESVGAQPWKSSAPVRGQFLLHRAIYLYRSRNFKGADDAFRVALEHAASIPDPLTEGRAWENWGLSFLLRRDWDRAERCFLASFRIRYLRRNPEYHRLFLHFAHLAREKGDTGSAISYARRAIVAAESGLSNYPAWAAYHAAAQSLQRAGDQPAALAEFRRALAHARLTRADVLPLDQWVVSSENSLFDLYSDFVAAAFPLAQRNPALMAEVWATAEENRRASLRLTSVSSRFPPEYREKLAQLQRLELAAPASATARTALAKFRVELWALESKLGLRSHTPLSTPALDLGRLQRSLESDTALISFLVTGRQSYAWLITRESISASLLPGRVPLSTLVTSFRHDLLRSTSADILSRAYFQKILGEFFPTLATKPYWTVIVDGPLFELPLPALPLPDGKGIVADRFAIAYSSGVPSPASSGASPGPDLVAFADPVYNRADARISPFRPASNSFPVQELPRLTGTARETAAVFDTWPGPKRLFTGPQASRQTLLDTIRQSPGILHLATHVIAAPQDPSDARIALSMAPDRETVEQVTSQELLHLRHHTGLVVMTGCASGRGQAVPGAGLVGLSRAWLVSGAQGVLASLWPMPDDSGELATAFYRHLKRLERGPPHRRWARALQSAQREMRQSSGWRSQAPYWASYFLLMRSERSGL